MKKRFFFYLLFLICAIDANAQIEYALVQVNGMTCSACTFAVQQSLQKLAFVKSVAFDLNSKVAKVNFTNEADIDLNKLSAKVADAGYSVGVLQIAISDSSRDIQKGQIISAGHSHFQVLNAHSIGVSPLMLTLVGKNFMDDKTFKKYKDQLPALTDPGKTLSTSFHSYYAVAL
jgi:copper chaperone CopZ